jgi:hypothetical protein
MHLKIQRGFFDVPLTAGLHGVVHFDLVRVSALDVNVSHPEAHMHVTAGDELARIVMRLFIFPVVARAQRDERQTEQTCHVEPLRGKKGSSRHGNTSRTPTDDTKQSAEQFPAFRGQECPRPIRTVRR